MTAILRLPHRPPWWCRTFGHTYTTQPTATLNPTRWQQPTLVPTRTYCRRCGEGI